MSIFLRPLRGMFQIMITFSHLFWQFWVAFWEMKRSRLSNKISFLKKNPFLNKKLGYGSIYNFWPLCSLVNNFFIFYTAERSNSYDGRVITVKLGDYTKKIGIDGSAYAIEETIKSSFRLRTKCAFWLEDEDRVVRTLGRDKPFWVSILFTLIKVKFRIHQSIIG